MKTGYANFAKALSLWIRRFFTVFGCLVMTLAVIGALLNTDNILFCTQLLWLALFSSLVACTFTVTDFLAKKQVGTVILRTVHFVLSYLSFLATFVFGGGAESYLKSNTALTNRIFMVVCMSFLFIGVYAAVSVVRFGYFALTNRRKQPATEYQKLYADMEHSQND